jgi:hypothetical protein
VSEPDAPSPGIDGARYNSRVTYRGHIRNGVVVLDLGASLPEGTPVSVEPLAISASSPGSPQAVQEVAGTWRGQAGEMNRLLEELRDDKRAEVDAERQR